MSSHRDTPSAGPSFKPVALKARHDGWIAERQLHFIKILTDTRSVSAACRAVGMSRDSAYKLKAHPDAAAGFALAWRRALAPDFARDPRRPAPAPAPAPPPAPFAARRPPLGRAAAEQLLARTLDQLRAAEAAAAEVEEVEATRS